MDAAPYKLINKGAVVPSPGCRADVPHQLVRRPAHPSVTPGNTTRTRRFVFIYRIC